MHVKMNDTIIKNRIKRVALAYQENQIKRLNQKGMEKVEMFSVDVTKGQLELLQLVDHLNAPDYYTSLKEVHKLGTYFCYEIDLVDLKASLHVSTLMESIEAIAFEKPNNQ